jgi:hypothetical protein
MVTLILGLAAVKALPSFSARGWTVVEPASVIVLEDAVVVGELEVVAVVIVVVVMPVVFVGLGLVVAVPLHPVNAVTIISSRESDNINQFFLLIIKYSSNYLSYNIKKTSKSSH